MATVCYEIKNSFGLDIGSYVFVCEHPFEYPTQADLATTVPRLFAGDLQKIPLQS